MDAQKCQTLYHEFQELLKEKGFDWVVAQVEDQVRLGKTIPQEVETAQTTSQELGLSLGKGAFSSRRRKSSAKDTFLSLFATFTRNREFRIELYLDCGGKELNKQRFDEMHAKSGNIEAIVGEPLQWERRDQDRACRIALYTKAQIDLDAQNPKLLDWAVQKAVAFHKAFSPEFPAKQQP